jgi:hypothetical protein
VGKNQANEPGLSHVYDVSYAVPRDLALHESYEWQLDDGVYALRIDGQRLTVDHGPAHAPVAVVRTTRAFLRRWVAGDATWDTGRASGEVTVTGSAAAWERMLLATGYPGRPTNVADQVRAQQGLMPAPNTTSLVSARAEGLDLMSSDEPEDEVLEEPE